MIVQISGNNIWLLTLVFLIEIRRYFMLVEKNKKAAISGSNVNDLDEAAIKKSLEEAKKEDKLIFLFDIC